jgi:nucleotide-binding universal stress UspA family protein
MADVKTILFPTDFSEFSNKAFPYAAILANSFNAKIIMLHVAELEEEDPANPAHTFPALQAYVGDVETERIIIRGHAPYKDILDVSRAKNCDLIVMATHGRSALSQFFLGSSVAGEVARFSTVPVFIVKVEASEPPETYAGRLKEVLYATDFSEPSLRAFDYAKTFAERFAAKLYALHVIDKESADQIKGEGIDPNDPDIRNKVEEILRQRLASIAQCDVTVHAVEGRADAEIVKFAESHNIDLVVIAAYGHSPFREGIIGTTCERVIRQAPCPVLSVRS